MALVYAVVFPNLWYGEHDISDVVIYQGYAQQMAAGQQPYRDFAFEYPPIAAWLMALPGHSQSYADYDMWFSLVMFVLTAITAVAVALAAARVWPSGWRPYAAAVLVRRRRRLRGHYRREPLRHRRGSGDHAGGAVFLARRQVLLAAAVLGFGFALKLTPAVLPAAGAAAGAHRATRRRGRRRVRGRPPLAPFIPYLIMSPGGVWHIFAYLLHSPVQLESVIATPVPARQALRPRLGGRGHQLRLPGHRGDGLSDGGHGEQRAHRRRRRGRLRPAAAPPQRLLLSSPRALPLAALAIVLAIMAFAKVLSPQFFIWLLPLAALAALEEPILGALCFATLFLTQINFPAKYWGLVYLRPLVHQVAGGAQHGPRPAFAAATGASSGCRPCGCGELPPQSNGSASRADTGRPTRAAARLGRVAQWHSGSCATCADQADAALGSACAAPLNRAPRATLAAPTQ